MVARERFYVTYTECLVNLDSRWREWSFPRADRFTLGQKACVIRV